MVAFLDEDSEKLEKDNRPFFQLYKNCNLIGPPRSRDPLPYGNLVEVPSFFRCHLTRQARLLRVALSLT